MTKLNEKLLSQLLEEIEVESADRMSLRNDLAKLKRVAIELAKHVEELKNYATMHICPDNEIAHALLVEVPFYADGVLSSAKGIIGGGE